MAKQNKIGVYFELRDIKQGRQPYCRLSYRRKNTKFSIYDTQSKNTQIADLKDVLHQYECDIINTIRFLEKKNVNIRLSGFSNVLEFVSEFWYNRFTGIIALNIVKELGEIIPYNIMKKALNTNYLSDEVSENNPMYNDNLINFIQDLEKYDNKIWSKINKKSKQSLVEYIIAVESMSLLNYSLMDIITNEDGVDEINELSMKTESVIKKKYKLSKILIHSSKVNYGLSIKSKLEEYLLLSSPASIYGVR